MQAVHGGGKWGFRTGKCAATVHAEVENTDTKSLQSRRSASAMNLPSGEKLTPFAANLGALMYVHDLFIRLHTVMRMLKSATLPADPAPPPTTTTPCRLPISRCESSPRRQRA